MSRLIIVQTLILLCMTPLVPVYGQSKKTISDRILKKIRSSAQLMREEWEFSFDKNHCVFNKVKNYFENDNIKISTFQLSIPLMKVKVERELKRYDTFFVCKNNAQCVTETWLDEKKVLKKSRTLNGASFYLSDMDFAEQMYKNFSRLQALCDRSFYPGPAGLNWGENENIVKHKLSSRFKYVTERTVRNGIVFQQEYKSKFSGFPTDKILVNFVDGGVFEMLVHLDVDEKLTYSAKWFEVTKDIYQKYGQPNLINLPSSVEHLDDLVNRDFYDSFEIFDSEMKEKRWSPDALWSYDNGAVIQVSVKSGIQKKELVWEFYDRKLKKLAVTRIEELPVADY
ncbi:MAG: hypothetical protein GY786_24185 [Proteobacteria bacterium]|nr:hypothetical protein [Pseudomonadota bacterium]